MRNRPAWAKWAKEPLTHDGVWFRDGDGNQIGTPDGWLDDKATIKRMLLCYNFMDGVRNSDIPRMREYIDAVNRDMKEAMGLD